MPSIPSRNLTIAVSSLLLPLNHPMVNVVIGGEFGALGGTGGDGAFKIAVVDAGGDGAHEPGQSWGTSWMGLAATGTS